MVLSPYCFGGGGGWTVDNKHDRIYFRKINLRQFNGPVRHLSKCKNITKTYCLMRHDVYGICNRVVKLPLSLFLKVGLFAIAFYLHRANRVINLRASMEDGRGMIQPFKICCRYHDRHFICLLEAISLSVGKYENMKTSL